MRVFYLYMPTKIFLIRHGQTDWNLKGIYQGHTDVDLNDTGRFQARMLSRKMLSERVDAVYSSDRARAINFACLVFGFRTINIEPGLREIGFGVFEGMDHSAISDKYGDLHSRWIEDPFGVEIPGGEPPSDFKKRVFDVFETITKTEDGKAAAIVTHGGVINTILNSCLNREDAAFIPALASISAIEFNKGRASALFLNNTEHLKNE